MATKKEIQKYLDLPWTYTIEPEKGYFILYVNELPGICTDAETIEEGMVQIKDAIYAAVKLYLDNGEEVPVPLDKKKFKGNISYRTSSEIHYKIAKVAKQEHMSVNKAMDLLIVEGIKQRAGRLRA
jgi:predicted RNase H-like HicB family nuclease